MSNDKQIQKRLELPHRETLVGINTIQTNPFDNQKTTTMSNNKQSSVEKMFQEMLGIQQEGIKLTFDENLDLLEKYKAMHKEEISEAFDDGEYNYFYSRKTGNDFENGKEYYEEKFGGNND